MKKTESRARRITRNTFFLASGEMIARLSTLAIMVYLNRHWTEVALYGQYSIAVDWVGIFAVVGELGLNALTVREVAHHREKTSFFLRHVLVLRSSFSILFWLALIGISMVLHYEPVLKLAIAVMGIRLILDAAEGGYIYLFQAHQEMGPYAMVNMFCALIRMLGIIAFVAAGAEVVGAGSIWVLASTVGLLTMIILGRKRGWKPEFKKYRPHDSWSVLKLAFPLATFGTLQTLYYRVDSVILKSLSGNEAVGFYDTASRIVLSLLAVSQLYSMAIYPVFSSLQDEPKAFCRLAAKASKVLFFLGLPISIGGFFLSTPLLVLVSGFKYAAAGPPFSILSLSILPFFLSNIYVDVLAVKNNFRLNLQFVLLLVLNVVLNFILIPRWQVQGAAWATVICEYLGVFSGFFLAAPYLGKMGRIIWFRPLAASLTAAGLMGVGIYFDPRLYWLGLGPVIYAVALYLFRGLEAEDLAGLKSVFRTAKA